MKKGRCRGTASLDALQAGRALVRASGQDQDAAVGDALVQHVPAALLLAVDEVQAGLQLCLPLGDAPFSQQAQGFLHLVDAHAALLQADHPVDPGGVAVVKDAARPSRFTPGTSPSLQQNISTA